MVINVRVSESGVCVDISGEDYVWYAGDVLYVRVICFVVRGCAVSRRYMNSDVFSILNIYIDDLKACLVCIHG